MNYYEHHLGDYAKDASHLSMVEEGAYRRLLDAYYTRERPLPGDAKQCAKLARAQSKADRDAVEFVLAEFFVLESDGCYHQGRADEEIEAYLEGEPERQQKREGARERQRRARERRRQLFELLRSHGIVADFSAKTADLEARLSRVTDGKSSPELSHPVTRDDTATKEGRKDTATQSPVPSPQSPEEEKKKNPAGSKKRPKKAPPDDFEVSERVRAWAQERGFDHLQQHLEAFLRKCRANGYAYADWDSAFMEAIREDWAKLRGRTANGAAPPPEAARASTTGALARMKADRMTPEEKAAADKARLEVMAALHQPRKATA